MLLFRSEEHVKLWCQLWHQPAGEIFSLAKAWALAQGWYHDRLAPDWRRKTAPEAQALFNSLGFTSSFWQY